MANDTVDYYKKIETDFLVEAQNLFRFGSIDDGGYYLKPSTLQQAEVLFSGGISSNLEFEYDAFRFNSNLKILMVDPTVSGFKLILKGLARLFFKKRDKIRYLYNALMFNYLIRNARCKHLSLWLNKEQRLFNLLKSHYNVDKNILLKLDIEGSEYDFLDEIVSNQKAINAIVIEFHDMHKYAAKVHQFIQNINNTFDLVYLGINPSGGFYNSNSPKCIEVTLERK